VITREDIRRLLAENHTFLERGAVSDDDAEFALDSMTLIWLVHRLREEHQLDVDLDTVDLNELTSVARIHHWLERSGRAPQMELDDAR
jgi:aryl carrier-like protein